MDEITYTVAEAVFSATWACDYRVERFNNGWVLRRAGTREILSILTKHEGQIGEWHYIARLGDEGHRVFKPRLPAGFTIATDDEDRNAVRRRIRAAVQEYMSNENADE